MLILAGTLLAVLLVRPLGGRLQELAQLQLRSQRLVVLAIAAQVVSLQVLPRAPRPLLVALHLASYALAAAFVWANRTLPGIWLIATGALSNALVIALNGGTLPASAEALRRAGLPLTEDGFTNSSVLAHPRLPALGDVFASPSWLPLHNVYSVGDLLLLAGAVWAVHRTCGTVLARHPRRVRRTPVTAHS